MVITNYIMFKAVKYTSVPAQIQKCTSDFSNVFIHVAEVQFGFGGLSFLPRTILSVIVSLFAGRSVKIMEVRDIGGVFASEMLRWSHVVVTGVTRYVLVGDGSGSTAYRSLDRVDSVPAGGSRHLVAIQTSYVTGQPAGRFRGFAVSRFHGLTVPNLTRSPTYVFQGHSLRNYLTSTYRSVNRFKNVHFWTDKHQNGERHSN